jgi:hypothetical protein
MGLLLIWMVLGAGVAHAASGSVHASLDRSRARMGDTVTLTLRFSGGASPAMPDLSGLRKDFQTLGSSTSRSQSWINGKVSTSASIAVTLRPLHAGNLRIPPLEVDGQRTRPLTLQVSDAPAPAQGGPGGPAFLQVSLSTHTPYAGQQVAVDLRLFYVPAMVNGSLGNLQAGKADIRPLGRQSRYQTQRNGKTYLVIERHYALIPQHAGTLELQPVKFSGQVMNAGNMGDFFGNGRAVEASSKTIKLQVRPRPDNYGKGAWLPARQVELTLDGLPASGKVHVGEPLTVTLHEGATGLPADTLPEPSLPTLDGADVYPDKPQDVTHDNGQWMTGSRSRSFAIVPNRAGTLQLPPINLKWWDVVQDKLRTAHIPAHTLTVLPAAAVAEAPASTSTTQSPDHAPPPLAAAASTRAAAAVSPPATAARVKGESGGHTWRAIALTSLLLWLLGALVLVSWWWRARVQRRADARVRQTHAHGVRRMRNAFLVAARGGDAGAAAQALLAWARVERPQVRHLQDLAERLEDADQIAAIERLQRSRYAHDADTPGSGNHLADAFRRGLSWRAAPADPHKSGLPPLYP